MKRRPLLPWYVIALSVVLVALFAAAPFFLANNPVAQLFFNLSLAIITTLVGVHATRHYSLTQVREDLTRYGLQAWRSLDSLQVKVSQHLGMSTIPPTTLHAWILDVDGAKWAWRDLLRELFEIQDRLQAESDEVVHRYKRLIAETSTADERSKLETKQAAEIAALSSRAPLPIKLPEEVSCPICGTKMTARVGSNPGDSDWPVCPNPGCSTKFPVFRKSDRTVATSDRAPVSTAVKPCPNCGADIKVLLYEDREVSFLTICSSCRTHIQFVGSPTEQELTDLGVENAKFVCPHCETESGCWIAPGRKVSFKKQCKACTKEARIIGTREKFEVRAA